MEYLEVEANVDDMIRSLRDRNFVAPPLVVEPVRRVAAHVAEIDEPPDVTEVIRQMRAAHA